MRLALTTATLGLTCLAETLPLQKRHGRDGSSALSSPRPHHGQKPLWKQAKRLQVVGNQLCDPDQEPDVGILSQQCAPGHVCQPLTDGLDNLDVGAVGGVCVAQYDGGTTQGRQLQAYDYCQLSIDTLGYDCNCDNWGTDNVGSYECTFTYPNTTFFGFPVSKTAYSITIVESAGASELYGLRTCYTALDNDTLPGFVQSYCKTDYFMVDQNGDYSTPDKGCVVSMNGQACDSCVAAFCEKGDDQKFANEEFANSFDCSNVNADAVVDDICGGNSIWKQLLADEYPTPAPVMAPPTAQPMMVDTPANGDDGETESPTPATVDEGGSDPPSPSAQSTGDDAPSSGEQPTALAGERSSAFFALRWKILPAVVGGLIGMAVALN